MPFNPISTFTSMTIQIHTDPSQHVHTIFLRRTTPHFGSMLFPLGTSPTLHEVLRERTSVIDLMRSCPNLRLGMPDAQPLPSPVACSFRPPRLSPFHRLRENISVSPLSQSSIDCIYRRSQPSTSEGAQSFPNSPHSI
jgi:hypothetical protein